MAKRLKVLVSAYACNPVRGSEPGVGWGFVRSIGRHHDLWVITEKEKCQSEVEKAILENQELANQVHFHFVQKKRNRLLRKIWPPSYYWYYRRWQWDSFLLGQQLHSKVGFDLTHQLTMVGFREPGYLWQLGIPFVWGPIGGMGFFPWRFLPAVGLKGGLYYTGYNCMNFLHSHVLRRPKLAAKIAGAGLITATRENQAGALNLWGCDSKVIPEVGLPCPISIDFTRRAEGEPLKIVWVGLHAPRKALGLALNGLSFLDRRIEWVLNVLGQGEKTEKWKRDTQQKGIGNQCRFHGWLPRHDALGIMRDSHVMLITSLRDLTSTVIIEALALGLPVICLDHCGFTDVITAECGMKIPVTTPAQVATAIAECVKKVWSNEDWRRKLASGALLRARSFSWEEKTKIVNEIYKEVIGPQ